MIKPNSFLHMHSINGVGGGFSHTLDFHWDSHKAIEKTDYGQQEKAREESKHSGSSISTDRDGHTHIYDHGCELAYSSSRSDQYSENGSWQG